MSFNQETIEARNLIISNSFAFTCPFCNQRLDCDNDLENKAVVCPSCNQEIVPIRNEFEGKIRVAAPPVVDSPPEGKKAPVHCDMAATPGQVVIYNYVNSTPPENSFFGNANAPKQRIVYILLGLFLGGFGVHNFYAGYHREGAIQLILSIIGAITSPPGFILCLAVGAWALANIICRVKDQRGRPMV